MEKFDLTVVGSGIGGSLTAALYQQSNHILFESDTNLGGCASTFKRFGHYFNVGATTFVGYEENHVLKKQFDSIGFKPDISPSTIAMRIVHNKKCLDRTSNFNEFLEHLNTIYPHPNNANFWKTLKSIDETFWQLKHLHYAKYSLSSYLKTLYSFLELFGHYKQRLFQSASSFIKQELPNISSEYQAFIDAQLFITVQSDSKNISLLSLALGLCYPFHQVYYANNGMGAIINGILKDVNIHTKEYIHTIFQEKDCFRIISNKNEYLSKNVVLNSSIYDTKQLFPQKHIHKYYEQFSFSDQSAFTLYMVINSEEKFLEHYQFIVNEKIPNSISNSFFVSFSKEDDKKLSKNGYSVTISTHTKAIFWNTLDTKEYEKQKQQTQTFIINQFLDYFDTLKKEDIVHCFSGTAKTFKRYINRLNCGGKAINLQNLWKTPTCTTPFSGLFNVGDTIFAGQGWPGVALGVDILQKELSARL